MAFSRLRQVSAELRSDAEIAASLPEVKRMARKAFVWLLANEVLIVAEVYPLKALVDTLQTKPFDVSRALRVVAAMAILYSVTSIVHWAMDIRRLRFFWRTWSLLWGFGHRVEQRQSVQWHKTHSTGDKESIMTKNVAKLEQLLDDGTFEAAPAILRILATTVGITIFIGWAYGLLSAVTILVFFAVAIRSNHAIVEERRQARKQERFVERFGTEMTANWRTLKSFGMEHDRCYENQGHLNRFELGGYKRDRMMITGILQQETVITCSRVGLGLLIIWQFQAGATTVGAMVLAFTWMQQIFNNFYRLSSFQRRLNETIEPMKELAELVLNEPEIRQPDQPVWASMQGKIEFRDVTFVYDGNDRPAIEALNLVIEPNQTLAITGPSGGGKSTLVELVARSYDPSAGAVLIDDVDLRVLDYDRFRREIIGNVGQDVQLFDMSVRDNIRFGAPAATDEEVEEASKEAYAHDFIESFPLGYDTIVGEDGILLSGGQKQRIAIARALLRKPRILVLDEATSSLDGESQHYVKEAIDRLIAAKICTIIVIAHRLSTVRSADLIVVIDDGQIVESGSHAELSRLNGFYRRMCELESQGILDEQ